MQAGARDRYQLPLALHEDDLLDTLVTDLYWPADRSGMELLARLTPLKQLARARTCNGLDSRLVHMPASAVAAATFGRATRYPWFEVRKDLALSRAAQRRALKRDAAIFSYSYYAAAAFSGAGQDWPYRFIFQIHPHSWPVRQLLREEWEMRPDARGSLNVEYELSLDDNAYRRLAEEPLLANGWVAASSYTASILSQQGIPRNAIHVVPYGVDTTLHFARTHPPAAHTMFTAIFVGSMIQRKGLAYLIDAIRMLNSRQLRLVLCGRGFRDDDLLARNSDLPIEVRVAPAKADLVKLIQASDLMVFPSLVEGFGHVILETMACGVPVLTTPNTCGPDVITNGIDGFIVPIRDAGAIAERLAWCVENRSELVSIGEQAALRAKEFTWERFRSGIRSAYRHMLLDACSTAAPMAEA